MKSNEPVNNIELKIDQFDSRTILRKFLEYIKDSTDASDEFVISNAIVGMAIAIGGNVYMPFGTQRLYANLYLAKIAGSSRMRKTTIDSLVTEILMEVCPKRIFPNDTTPERLLDNLSSESAALLRFTELGGALKKMERSNYMQGMKAFLTEVYDVPAKYERDIKGGEKDGRKTTLLRPTVSIMASSTVEWFKKGIEADDFSSGFLARFLFSLLRNRTKEKKYLPENVDENKKLDLIKDLKRLGSDWKGEKVLSASARDLYETSMRSNEADLDLTDTYEKLAPSLDRLEKCVLKIAMIMEGMIQVSLGENFKNTNEISVEAMEYSLHLCRYFQNCLIELMLGELHIKNNDPRHKQVIGQLQKYGREITRRELEQDTKIYSKDLREILTILEAQGKVKCRSEKTRGGTTFLVKLLEEDDSTEVDLGNLDDDVPEAHATR